jgi:CRISPR/Cas system-associated exonuclease Cas4 (RecB family)
MRTFQTCKKKHYYTYELGVERVDEEERESIWFGNLYHEALEAFFITLKKEQQNGSNISASLPAIGVGTNGNQ